MQGMEEIFEDTALVLFSRVSLQWKFGIWSFFSSDNKTGAMVELSPNSRQNSHPVLYFTDLPGSKSIFYISSYQFAGNTR
jgi:hypothetical protein